MKASNWGSEFVSRDMDLWACQRGVIKDFSPAGKLTVNAFIEAFNSKLRSECLNISLGAVASGRLRKFEAMA